MARSQRWRPAMKLMHFLAPRTRKPEDGRIKAKRRIVGGRNIYTNPAKGSKDRALQLSPQSPPVEGAPRVDTPSTASIGFNHESGVQPRMQLRRVFE
jgi:hypothetical protein